MKNGEVIELYESLKRISENKDIKFNVFAGYMLSKNKEILRQEASLIYKMRQDIILEHGVLNGKDITISNEYIDEVNKKINDLMEIENDIELKLIPVEFLDENKFSLDDMEAIAQIIEPFTLASFTTHKKIDG